MLQSEIDEISGAFLDAWEEFFGTKMLYIPFDANSESHSIYNESMDRKYLHEEVVEFHGIIKEREDLDVTSPTGKGINKLFEITVVTQELVDGGVTHIDTNSIIKYTDRFGKEYTLSIYDEYQKVQFVDNKIFTKLRVRYSG